MIMMMSGIMIGTLTLLIIMTVMGRMNYAVELKSQLSSVVEETVENMMQSKIYQIEDQSEFLAEFVEQLALAVDSKADVGIRVQQADTEHGILTVTVIESFSHPNGRTGTVSCDRTVIFNQLEEENEVQYTVRFFQNQEDMVQNSNCYKQIEVLANQGIAAPIEPSPISGRFAGWFDKNGYMADFTQPVTQDIVYYAAWE